MRCSGDWWVSEGHRVSERCRWFHLGGCNENGCGPHEDGSTVVVLGAWLRWHPSLPKNMRYRRGYHWEVVITVIFTIVVGHCRGKYPNLWRFSPLLYPFITFYNPYCTPKYLTLSPRMVFPYWSLTMTIHAWPSTTTADCHPKSVNQRSRPKRSHGSQALVTSCQFPLNSGCVPV